MTLPTALTLPKQAMQSEAAPERGHPEGHGGGTAVGIQIHQHGAEG